ncbi:ATP-binding protein [Nonomuraea dietziae]|uniref:ATP-binding protein n=1 Tax=Nonomuraea dietziae TaxID=65515 RepID=UPI0031CF2A3B
MLVLAANPCPCAQPAGAGERCQCSPAARRRYLGRLSGPLLDRIDMKVTIARSSRRELMADRQFVETSRWWPNACRWPASVRQTAGGDAVEDERRIPRRSLARRLSPIGGGDETDTACSTLAASALAASDRRGTPRRPSPYLEGKTRRDRLRITSTALALWLGPSA